MKHLKLLAAVILSLVMIASICAASAEELPYMEQMAQDIFTSSVTLLTTDSYPEVCISPNYFSSMFVSQYSEPYFIRFACPANTFLASFDEYSCSFLDLSNLREYDYIAQSSYAYETFLNNCDNDDYIIADGSNGLAIYLDPDRARARLLLSAAEIDKNAKLEIHIYDYSLRNKSEQQAVEALTQLANEEAARVQSSMRVELMDRYWTDGNFAGFKTLSTATNTEGLILTYTLPEGYITTDMDGVRVNICKVESKGNALRAEFKIETYSYVNSQLEDDPEHVYTATIDGEEYRFWAQWYEDEKIISVYVDRAISTTAGYNGDDTLYLTIRLTPDGEFKWTSVEALEADLATITSGIHLDYDQPVPDYRDATPYQAAAVAAAEGTDSEEVACSNCGYVPEGETPNFCPNCGTAF